jgi:3-dehydroquinate synthase
LDVPPKSLEQAATIWKAMTVHKPDVAVAVGGGTVCDLTGFTASTFRRGIPFVLFPTTLLAMADAAISGKTGIDFNSIKNSVGTIHYSSAVVGILETLNTLGEQEFRSGLSEIVKVAVTSDATFFDWLEEHSTVLYPGDTSLMQAVQHSCFLKAKIVEGNPQIRLHSLYGHLIGQAIEALGIDHKRHGDCVSIGLNAEGFIAFRIGLWQESEWQRQRNLLESFQLPLTIPPDISLEQLLESILKDKHASKTAVKMILPSTIGTVNTVNGNAHTTVPVDLLVRHLQAFCSHS